MILLKIGIIIEKKKYVDSCKIAASNKKIS